MAEWAVTMGPLGLFVVSFLAATILPFSSEVALAAGIGIGIPKTTAVVACSVGNCLACAFNYAMGRFFREKLNDRLLNSRSGRTAVGWMERYGPWSLLMSWAPVIGDPITIAAGAGRVRFLLFVVVVFSLRIGRYLLIAAAL